MNKSFFVGLAFMGAALYGQITNAQTNASEPVKNGKEKWVAAPVERPDGVPTGDTVYLQSEMMQNADNQFSRLERVRTGLDNNFTRFLSPQDKEHLALQAQKKGPENCYTAIVFSAKHGKITDRRALLLCDADSNKNFKTEGKASETMMEVDQFYDESNNPNPEAYVFGYGRAPDKNTLPQSATQAPLKVRQVRAGSYVRLPVIGSKDSVDVDAMYMENISAYPFHFNGVTPGVPATVRNMLSESDDKDLNTKEQKSRFYSICYSEMTGQNEVVKNHIETYADLNTDNKISPNGTT